MVNRSTKAVLTDEDRRNLKGTALELYEIRRLIMKLAEILVNLSDKELLKILEAEESNIGEKQVDSYKETLQKQVDIAEKEFRS